MIFAASFRTQCLPSDHYLCHGSQCVCRLCKYDAACFDMIYYIIL